MWSRICWLIYKQTWRLCACISDVNNIMLLVHLVLLHVVACLDVQVEGDLAFDLWVPSRPSGKGRWFRVGWETGSQVQQMVFRMRQMRNNVTVSPLEECVYQYPEKKQVDAVLSNMMNELTKVFVQANEFMNGLKTNENVLKKPRRENFAMDVMLGMRGNTNTEPKKEENNETMKEDLRDRTRFRVIDKKQKPFFEHIYKNMTDEYRNFYNATTQRVDRSGRDPCNHQAEVKQMWRDLLQNAQATLRTAAQRFVDEYLRDTNAEEEAQMRVRLKHYLQTELSKVSDNQLNMLCDTYQLCYYELWK